VRRGGGGFSAMELRTDAYHATKEKAALEICGGGFDYTRCSKNSRLGPGAYFFDDIDRAIRYTKNASHLRDHRCSVLSCVIRCSPEHLLDLTKIAQRNELKRVVAVIVKKTPELNNKQAESVAVQMVSESQGVGVVKMIMPSGWNRI
jgi:hypothetical protein